MASRVNFKVIIDKYRALGKANVRLTQSTLFLTKPIQANTTNYNFDVLETQNQTLQNDEIRLNLNDDFIITQLGMYLVADYTGVDQDGTVYNGTKLLTYAPTEITGNMVGVQDFYSGSLQIAVNNIVYLDKYDSRKHEFVPRTQYANWDAVNNVPSTQASIDYSKDAMFDMEPLLTLSGAKKNTITLSLPRAISQQQFTVTATDGLSVNYFVKRVGILMRGLNGQNASVFQG
jgi:hypothetical protein